MFGKVDLLELDGTNGRTNYLYEAARVVLGESLLYSTFIPNIKRKDNLKHVAMHRVRSPLQDKPKIALLKSK
jgi:hypothetical protein